MFSRRLAFITLVVSLVCFVTVTFTVAFDSPPEEALLVQGPLKVNLVDDAGQSRECWLQRLTTARLLWRNRPYGPVNQIEARLPSQANKAKSIRQVGGKLSWAWDSSKRQFTGPIYQVNLLDLAEIKRIPTDRASAELAMVWSLERFRLETAPAFHFDRQQLLDVLHRQAAERLELARNLECAPAVQEAYLALLKALGTLKENRTKQQAILDRHERELRALAKQRAAAKDAADFEKRLGLLQAIVGAMQEELIDVDRRIVLRRAQDPESIYSGLVRMVEAERQEEEISLRIEAVATQLGDEKAEGLRAIQEESRQALRTVGTLPEQTAQRTHGLNLMPLSPTDMKIPLRLLLEKRRKQLAAQLAAWQSKGHKHPFLLAAKLAEEAKEHQLNYESARDKNLNPPVAEKFKAIDTLCDQLVKSAQALLVEAPFPDHAVFDADRAWIEAQAADFLLQAAHREIGNESWKSAYNPKADAASRLLGRCLENRLDPEGRLRDQQSLACILAGDLERGWELAEGLCGLREADPDFWFRLARIRHLNAETTECHDALLRAFKAGFEKLKTARISPDLPKELPETRKLLKFDVTAEFVDHRGPVKIVRMRNNSQFMLTNVQVEWKQQFDRGPLIAKKFAFAQILPGQEEDLALNDPREIATIPVHEMLVDWVDSPPIRIPTPDGGFRLNPGPKIKVQKKGKLLLRKHNLILTLSCPQTHEVKPFFLPEMIVSDSTGGSMRER